MNITGQNIVTTQGDNENIAVVLDLTDVVGLDIETCNFTWVAYKQTTEDIVLQKTTVSGIVADNVAGEIVISIARGETDNLLGHYLHICKMVDDQNNEYTVCTGTLDVGRSPI